ncbi:hypothetical protein PRZ48_011806 [Zasmidium cellare]|uniref:Glutamate decarboxylase n=1 Tax=Zasmidium cellare TaxID=395010 RepID=A0ABR0E7L2_ZASCE|nr:hypothetical protein PRZ48_011806 [Zasmidium cellare]
MTGTKTTDTNGEKPLQRAEEAEQLLSAVQQLVTSFIRSADEEASAKSHLPTNKSTNGPSTTLLEPHGPRELQQLLNFSLPQQGLGHDGFVGAVENVLRYSVNTWDQGFIDKLYANTTPVGLAADLLLSSLNTNVHVYQVSPALTITEKTVTKAVASMLGFTGPNAGGVSQPGGSAANQSSMVIARNNLFPETKTEGNGTHRFVLFTSAHGHYSVEKASQICGFGSKAVRAVDVDERGCMRPDALDTAIRKAKEAGETPFYVNATAGTTVLGSFDPIDAIADVCQKHGLWLHVDGSWGGSVIFSEKHRSKLQGISRADSVAICAHKMLNVPLTCSFLFGKDLRQFHKGMTLPAGYLFHNPDEGANGVDPDKEVEYWDVADLTPQCGRRGDSLKLALTWLYYGTSGLADYIDHAFEIAAYLASLVKANPRFSLVSENPPPCLQVCFYFDKQSDAERNSKRTARIVELLVGRGFMTDYAPGPEGKFFRVVVNGQTRRETMEGLVRSIEEVGGQLGSV